MSEAAMQLTRALAHLDAMEDSIDQLVRRAAPATTTRLLGELNRARDAIWTARDALPRPRAARDAAKWQRDLKVGRG